MPLADFAYGDTCRPYFRHFMHQHKISMKKMSPLKMKKCTFFFFLEKEKNVNFFLLGGTALFSKILPDLV